MPRHEKNGKPLLVLFDGMALAYRAYFAFLTRPLLNSRGENTSAVYGFTTALLQFLEHHDPTHAAVCFDTMAPTFRHVKYKAYKANRQAMPDDMAPQIGKIKDLVRAYRIPLIELDGFEADDIIGTLARVAEQQDTDTLIVTPDKDFCQLVTPRVKLLRPAKEGRDMEIIDEEGVRARYNLEPNQIIDYLALVGDTSDNIPGVRGVGEKSAAPLLQQYGSVKGIYASIASIEKKSLKEKLLLEMDNAFLSYELATIDINVPLKLSLQELSYGEKPDYEALEAMLVDLNFKSLVARMRRDRDGTKNGNAEPTPAATITHSIPSGLTPEEQELDAFEFGEASKAGNQSSFGFELPPGECDIHSSPHAYVLVRTLEGVQALAGELERTTEFAVDLESTSTDANRAEIIGISFCWEAAKAFYIPIGLKEQLQFSENLFETADRGSATGTAEENAFNSGLPLAKVLDLLRGVLEDPAIAKIGQNIKYDALLLRHYGIKLAPLAFDTMVAAYILRNEGSHDMDSLSREYLKYRPVPLSDVTGQLRGTDVRNTMGLASTPKLAEYGAEDADVTFRLRQALEPKLLQEELLNLCRTIDFPLVEVLTEVEFNGVKIDTELLAEASITMEREAESICRQVYEYAGGAFNLDSTKQLADVLFNRLNLRKGKKTKTGFSTNAAVLEELRDEHPIAECILNYRQYQKLRGTYVDAIPLLVNPKTGMVHTSYNQAVVATGRISSTDPNLQNIPIRTEMGRDIRKAFVSRWKDGQILSADYSQIELRIMAHVTNDTALVESFANREDIHTRTAAGVFNVPLTEVNRDMRRKAKEVNYGIMYGIGPFGLSRRLGITQREGAEIIQQYFLAFPTIKEYMDKTVMFVREHGFVQTLLGRRRYFRNINVSNQAVRSGEERAAINMPIQGTAADMMKIAMINIHREIKKRNLRSLMIMQVHDELVFDVVLEEAEEMKSLVEELMSQAMPMIVPIEVEAGIGRTWFDAH